MIHLVGMLAFGMLILLALKDPHILTLGVSAMGVGVGWGLWRSGAIGESLNKLKAVLKIRRKKEATIETTAGVRAVQVVLMPVELKLQLERIAKLSGRSVNAVMVDALWDTVWLESILENAKAPMGSDEDGAQE